MSNHTNGAQKWAIQLVTQSAVLKRLRRVLRKTNKKIRAVAIHDHFCGSEYWLISYEGGDFMGYTIHHIPDLELFAREMGTLRQREHMI